MSKNDNTDYGSKEGHKISFKEFCTYLGVVVIFLAMFTWAVN